MHIYFQTKKNLQMGERKNRETRATKRAKKQQTNRKTKQKKDGAILREKMQKDGAIRRAKMQKEFPKRKAKMQKEALSNKDEDEDEDKDKTKLQELWKTLQREEKKEIVNKPNYQEAIEKGDWQTRLQILQEFLETKVTPTANKTETMFQLLHAENRNLRWK
jgi:hypothetical protein